VEPRLAALVGAAGDPLARLAERAHAGVAALVDAARRVADVLALAIGAAAVIHAGRCALGAQAAHALAARGQGRRQTERVLGAVVGAAAGRRAHRAASDDLAVRVARRGAVGAAIRADERCGRCDPRHRGRRPGDRRGR
jgi:hypothetical protein